MNPTRHPLDRLIKSAGRSAQEEATPMSYRTEARMLAHWRTLQAGPCWYELLPLLRRGLAVACAASALLAAASFTQIQSSTPDAWAMASRVAYSTYTP
jgi:hypothetical protein